MHKEDKGQGGRQEDIRDRMHVVLSMEQRKNEVLTDEAALEAASAMERSWMPFAASSGSSGIGVSDPSKGTPLRLFGLLVEA